MAAKVRIIVALVVVVLAVAATAVAEQLAARQPEGGGSQGATAPLVPVSKGSATPSGADTSRNDGSSPSSSSSASAVGVSHQSNEGGCTPTRTGGLVVKGSLQGFYPSAINITVGQVVTFTMGPMAFSCAFDQVGSFTYHCADHPFMTVAVNVRD